MKKASMYKNIIIWLVVIAVLAIFMNPGSPVSMEALEGEFVMQGNSGYIVRITYAEIQFMELREGLDYGMLVSGVDGKKEKSGTWENEEFGEYQLCVDAKVSSCIILHTKTGIQVVNIESDKSTAGLYKAILNQTGNME